MTMLNIITEIEVLKWEAETVDLKKNQRTCKQLA